MTRLARHLFASVFLSAMLAALLSVLPSLSDPAGSPSDKPVFSPVSPVWISKDSLVDFLAGQPVSLRILRASWEDGYLSLDLESEKDPDRDRVYADLFTLIRNSLVTAKNVEAASLSGYTVPGRIPVDDGGGGSSDLSGIPGWRTGKGCLPANIWKGPSRCGMRRLLPG